MDSKTFIFTILFSTIVLIPFTSATKLSFFETDINLEWEKANFDLTLIFDERPESFRLPIFYQIEKFEYETNFENGVCNQKEENWGTLIKCDFSKAEGRGQRLSLKYSSSQIISDLEKRKMLDVDVAFPLKTEKAVIRATLNEGLVLMREGNETALSPFSPRDGNKGSDGRRIYVYWERKDVPKGEKIGVTLLYEKLKKEGFKLSRELLFLAGSGFLILVLLFLIFYSRKKPEISVLKEDERNVVEILENYGGECKQKRIVKETEYSKTKVSRLIKNLKERGLVEIERLGRTNRIKLKEPTKEKG